MCLFSPPRKMSWRSLGGLLMILSAFSVMVLWKFDSSVPTRISLTDVPTPLGREAPIRLLRSRLKQLDRKSPFPKLARRLDDYLQSDHDDFQCSMPQATRACSEEKYSVVGVATTTNWRSILLMLMQWVHDTSVSQVCLTLPHGINATDWYASRILALGLSHAVEVRYGQRLIDAAMKCSIDTRAVLWIRIGGKRVPSNATLQSFGLWKAAPHSVVLSESQTWYMLDQRWLCLLNLPPFHEFHNVEGWGTELEDSVASLSLITPVAKLGTDASIATPSNSAVPQLSLPCS